MSLPVGSIFCEPYPELIAKLQDGALCLETPWLAITAEVQPAAREFAGFCVKNLNNKKFQAHVSDFLEPFSNYPVAFLRSRDLGPPQLAMESTDVLEFSWTGKDELFDGLAALTFLRHRLLCWESRHRDLRSKNLEISDGTPDLARKAVFQNYYVTSRCGDVLAKAVGYFPQCKDLLTTFIQEEKGHDKLLQAVVERIGPCSGGVLAETKTLMEILEDSITQGVLAFAVGLEVFEGIEFTTKDSPLAGMVIYHFGREAARPLQMHYDINRCHKHGQVGAQLMRNVSTVGREDVIGATVVVEKIQAALGGFYSALHN